MKNWQWKMLSIVIAVAFALVAIKSTMDGNTIKSIVGFICTGLAILTCMPFKWLNQKYNVKIQIKKEK